MTVPSTQLAYQAALTPTVTSISPRRGSTAGGTLITLTVAGLPSGIGASDAAVTIVGLPCAVQSVTASEVTCLTASYGVTSAANPGSGPVRLTLLATGTAAATSNATYEYIDLWSRYTTWGGEFIGGVKNTIPGLETTGDSIWIQTGQRILLDCNIKVYMLIVQGSLEFDRQDLTLDANYIFVMGGSFVVGTEAEPFLHQATITLHGSPVSQENPNPNPSPSPSPNLNPSPSPNPNPNPNPGAGDPRLRRQVALVPLLHARPARPAAARRADAHQAQPDRGRRSHRALAARACRLAGGLSSADHKHVGRRRAASTSCVAPCTQAAALSAQAAISRHATSRRFHGGCRHGHGEGGDPRRLAS